MRTLSLPLSPVSIPFPLSACATLRTKPYEAYPYPVSYIVPLVAIPLQLVSGLSIPHRIVSHRIEHTHTHSMSSPPPSEHDALAQALLAHVQQHQAAFEQRMNQQQQEMMAQFQRLVQGTHTAAAATAPQHQHHPATELPHALTRHVRAPEPYSGTNEENLKTWLLQEDTYFQLVGVTNHATRIAQVGLHLKKAALQFWAQYEVDHNTTWDMFKEALVLRFRPIENSKIARTKLYALRQYGCKDVADYSEKFRALMENIPDMHVTDQVDHCRRGLVPHLQKELVQHEYDDLSKIMNAAVRVDHMERLVHPTHGGRPFRHGLGGQFRGGYNAPRGGVAPSSSPASTSSPMELGNINNNNNRGRVPGLSQEEFRRLRTEGKCFRCKKTGHVANRCPDVKDGLPQRRPPGRVNNVYFSDGEHKDNDDDSNTDSDRLNGSPQ